MGIDIAAKVLVVGHRGMVGSAIFRQLTAKGYTQIETPAPDSLDFRRQESVESYFRGASFDQVYLAAARVGGIQANSTRPGEFIYDNLMIASNVIHGCHVGGIQKLLYLGSSCIYPRSAPQPMKESVLLTGPLEPTNEPYAVAKIAGLKMCESYNRQYRRDYRSVMPTNLYGPNDNFHPTDSHVIPALIRRFHEAKLDDKPLVEVWGSGTPMREFMHVDDMASACIHVMELPVEVYRAETSEMQSHINVGTGIDRSIRELAELIAEVVGFQGKIRFDASRPDGAPRKLLDVSKLGALGWRPRISLRAGLESTYKWFVENQHLVRS